MEKQKILVSLFYGKTPQGYTKGRNGGMSNMIGAGLKAARKAMGLTQTELGTFAGVARCTVSYWENKQGQLQASGGLNLILDALGLFEGLSDNYAHAGGWGFTDSQQEALDRAVEKEHARLAEKAKHRAALLRVPCLAKTRKGRPCKLMSEAGRNRCKFHGGMSTGPKTPEGKARIAAAQILRWQRYRDGNP